jgi:hypothetical protein
MQHRPFPKHAAGDLPADKLLNPGMTVITANAHVGCSYRFIRAFQQL